jgi:hypothetical protein
LATTDQVCRFTRKVADLAPDDVAQDRILVSPVPAGLVTKQIAFGYILHNYGASGHIENYPPSQNAAAIPARQDAEAIVLDLMSPISTGRRFFRQFRQAGLDRDILAFFSESEN